MLASCRAMMVEPTQRAAPALRARSRTEEDDRQTRRSHVEECSARDATGCARCRVPGVSAMCSARSLECPAGRRQAPAALLAPMDLQRLDRYLGRPAPVSPAVSAVARAAGEPLLCRVLGRGLDGHYGPLRRRRGRRVHCRAARRRCRPRPSGARWRLLGRPQAAAGSPEPDEAPGAAGRLRPPPSGRAGTAASGASWWWSPQLDERLQDESRPLSIR